jgi:hypothetical protein
VPSDLVTLSDVHDFLNIPTGDTSHDTKLQHYIDAASQIVAYEVGDVTSTTHTETHVPTGSRIILDWVPVLSIQTVTEYVGVLPYTLTSQPPGSTSDNYGYSLDLPNAGVLVRRDAAGQECNFFGSPVVVAYTSGRTSIPSDVFLAVLEDIRGLYQQTQSGGRPGFQTPGSDQWNAGPLNLFPRLRAVLASSVRTQSIA